MTELKMDRTSSEHKREAKLKGQNETKGHDEVENQTSWA